MLETAQRFIERAPLATLDQPGLHELIDNIQLRIHDVHDGIAQIYFPSRDVDRRAAHAVAVADTIAAAELAFVRGIREGRDLERAWRLGRK